jgi:hypothetical protein
MILRSLRPHLGILPSSSSEASFETDFPFYQGHVPQKEKVTAIGSVDSQQHSGKVKERIL